MLILHQSNRLEHLARRLAELLSQPTGNPLRADWVVVQHPGMARWLSLALAQSLGIAANLEFPLPAVFVWQAFRQLLGDVPELDLYQPKRLAWRIHEQLALRDFSGEPSLSAYLKSGDELRRFQLAQELANLYDRYLLYRPDWIAAWERGETAIAGDAWQAEIWRGLTRAQGQHWVRLQQQFFVQPPGGDLGDLPQRIYLFGLPTLSPGYLQILRRLSESLHLHLFLLNPCAAHWADIVPPRSQARCELAGETASLYLEVGHPLLATLGRQGRDFFAAINELDPGSEELFEASERDTLLAKLQNQILNLESPEAGTAVDDSITLHLCHSPMREVEVLYDQLLAMFEATPGLAPNEILVMTPQIDRYAPLIEAVFGEPGDRPAIPFRISDRSLLQRNPLATVLLELLDIPGSRYTIGQLLSLLEQPAVQRRFALDEAALNSITQWLIAAGIRWGRDGESKAGFGLPADAGNTWRAGLQRLLLGYTMPQRSEDLWRGIVPLDAVEGSAAEQLGGLLDFCNRLFALEQRLAPSRTVIDWQECLLSLVQDFLLPDAQSQEQADELRGIIQQLAEEAQEAGFEGEVSLRLIRYRLQALCECADGRGFLGGGVTCCALAPMRSLPFRVICLLGMNDGDFPSRQPSLGFDLMAGSFRFGDRSRRLDDRYLFLETLISARDRLYISYIGRSQRDNSPLPPAVVVDELYDTLRRMSGEEGLAELVHHHPLQAYSPDYFKSLPGLFSYSSSCREAAIRVGRGMRRDTALTPTPLVEEPRAVLPAIALERLIEFFTNPPRMFARERLGLSLESVAELPEEREPFELVRFERLDGEHEMVEALMCGTTPESLLARLEATGYLPHGEAGRLIFSRMLQHAEATAARLRRRLAGAERSVYDIDLTLRQGRVSGRLHALTVAGLLAYSTARFYPHQLLRHWIEHLLLNLAKPPGVAPQSHLLEGGREGIYHPPEDARALLDGLLELYWQGQDRPLPFYPATAWAYMKGLSGDDREQAMQRARIQWYGNRYQAGDAAKPYNRLMWPDGNCFRAEFASLNETILGPLLAHLEWH
jgi:exodeoxyribonuclease V gamma subunit